MSRPPRAPREGGRGGSPRGGADAPFVHRDISKDEARQMFADVPGGGERLTGISLVEQQTTVGQGGGKRTLDAGTLLYSRDGNLQKNNIYIFEPDEVGATTTGNRGEKLVDGNDISRS